MHLLVIFSLYAIASLTDAEPIRGCSGVKGNYFVGDRQNPCVYYWCENGYFLQWVFPCSRGSAVPYGYFGQIVPCIDNRRTCQGGAPTAALIRDPELDDSVHFHTTTPHPYHSQSALDDDIPTLSHKAKQLPTMDPQWYDTGVMGRQGQDTPEPVGKDEGHEKGSNKVEMGGSTARNSMPTTAPYQVTKTASTTPGTTRQVPSTTGGPLFSSVFPQTDKPTLDEHDEEGGRGHGASSTPDVQIDDRRTLAWDSVADSSPEGVRHSTVVPMSENDIRQRREEDSTMRPDKDVIEHSDIQSSKRPYSVVATMSPTGQLSPKTPEIAMPTHGFVKVVSRTPPLTSTTTTPTSPPTTTLTTRRTTTSRTTTSTTPRSTRRTTPSTTTPSRATTTTTSPITTPDDEDDFDFFGFESQGGPTGDIDSLPRVIDHGEGGLEEEEREQEEKVRPTQETTTPNATTRGLPEFLRTTRPALPKTPRTQPPLSTTRATPTTTQMPTTTTTQPSSTTSTTLRTTTTQASTTTTEKPTTTPAPTADACYGKMPMRGGGQVITQVFPQHHIIGGERRVNFTFQIGVIHVTLEIKMASMCYLACDLHPGCAGFDWDIEDRSCWFHTEERECTSTVTHMGGAIAHYRLEACGKVSDTDSPKSKGTPAAGIDGSKPEGERRPTDQFVSQLTSGSEPAVAAISPFPNNLQADEMAGTLRDPGRMDDFEHGQLLRVFNMIIDHSRNRKRERSEEETGSEWVHGS